MSALSNQIKTPTNTHLNTSYNPALKPMPLQKRKLKSMIKIINIITIILISSSLKPSHAENNPNPHHKIQKQEELSKYNHIFGTNWHYNLYMTIRSYDKRNKTKFSSDLHPKIITGPEALKILRDDDGGLVLGDQTTDTLSYKAAQRDTSIALYWEFPKESNHPKALLLLPFPEDMHDEAGATGVLGFIGLKATERAVTASKAVEVNFIEFKKAPENLEYVLLLEVEGCGSNSIIKDEIRGALSSKLTSKKLLIYEDNLTSHTALISAHYPNHAGPILMHIGADGVVKDAQGLSYNPKETAHFFWRAGYIKDKPPLFKGWKISKDSEYKKVLKTISVYNKHSGVDFSKMNLKGASFNKSVISGSSFEKADLTISTFDGAFIYKSNFKGAKISKKTFTGAKWIDSVCPNGHKSDPKSLSCPEI